MQHKIDPHIASWATNNEIDKLKEWLSLQDTLLSGHSWDYHTSELNIENAARDAILAGHEEFVQLLLQAGLSLDCWAHISETNSHQIEQLIYFAAKSGRLGMVKLLVKNAAEIYIERSQNHHHRNKEYGLGIAVSEGHTDIVRYLLECGADPMGLYHVSSAGIVSETTFLAKAAADGNTAIVDALIRYGASIPKTLKSAYKRIFVEQYQRRLDYIQSHMGKKESLQEVEQAKNVYLRILKTCMDYAMGCDFKNLSFLKGIDVSDISFLGVSRLGHPITPQILGEFTTIGIERAIITIHHLRILGHVERRNALQGRLRSLQAEKGILETETGIVNLVPLIAAAKTGDLAAVKTRILAGEDPNTENGRALILASENGQAECVKVLLGAHVDCTNHQARRLITKAREQLSTYPRIQTYSVDKGRILPIPTPLPLEDDQYQMVIPGSHRLTEIMLKIKEFDEVGLNAHIRKIAIEFSAKNLNFVLVVPLSASFQHLSYGEPVSTEERRKYITQMITSAESKESLPVLFTNIGNFDVMETLIIAQYQEIDQGKAAYIEAIKLAKRNKHESVVTFLLENQDINFQNENGETKLHIAVYNGDVREVQKLLQKKGIDVNIANNQGTTALGIAAKNSCHLDTSDTYNKIAELLLENKADANEFKRTSPLELAVEASNPKLVALLLPITEKKDVVGYVCGEARAFPWYYHLMFNALNKRDGISLLSLLKKHGADFNTKGRDGNTLLHMTIYFLPSFHYLPKQEKHDPTGGKEYSDYLVKTFETMYFLFAEGANPNIANDHGQTPLMDLLNKEDLELLKEAIKPVLNCFLDHQANVNAVDKHGKTALHRGAGHGNISAMEYLLNHGAEVDIRDTQVQTPLHYAAAYGKEFSASLLLEHHADANAKNQEDLTPSQVAKKSMEEGKRKYKFNSDAAEKEFEAKYSAVQWAIQRALSNPINKDAVQELVRQRSKSLGIPLVESGKQEIVALHM